MTLIPAVNSTERSTAIRICDMLEVHQALAVVSGQIELLDRLEMQIRGWHEWTEELEGHWSKVKTSLICRMNEIKAEQATECQGMLQKR